jgi:hypothetical protein
MQKALLYQKKKKEAKFLRGKNESKNLFDIKIFLAYNEQKSLK